jgi:glutaredoxin-like protein
MALLSEQDRQTLRTHLADIANPVRLLFFTQTIGGPETALIARQILDEITSLSDRITFEVVNFILEKDRAAAFGITDVPAIAVLKGDVDTRIRFLGAPAGYEFMSLIEAILLAGGSDSGLSQESKTLIAEHVAEPLDIKVFVTPTCPHCPRAVTLAHRMAFEHPLIHATCVEATEFIDLSRQYRVTGVPKTVVNGTIEILGAVPEDTFVRTVLQQPSHASDTDGRGTSAPR